METGDKERGVHGHPLGGEPGTAPVVAAVRGGEGNSGQQERGPWSSGLVTEQKLQWGRSWTPHFRVG